MRDDHRKDVPPAPGPTDSDLVGREDTYRRIYDRAADAIFIHSKENNRFLDCNSTALDRYGYSVEEIRQMSPYDLHPPEEFGAVADQINVRNVDAPNFYQHITKDGRVFPVEILSEEVEYNGVPAWASIARDISERRRAAEEIAASRDKAVAASQAKSDFVAGISHELRTPMNGIMGMVALLLETDLTGEQREYAQTITSAADSMLDLLNEILDLSKIESGRLELEPIPFDLQESISSVVSLLLPHANSANIDLIFHISPDLPNQLVGDPTRIRQVITNLAANAIKFTSDGHVAIKVRGRTEGDGVALRFSVEDTGIGIAEDRQEAIFEEFIQAELSTTRNYGGTGLGLAISRRLVDLMGGELQVESVTGEGSTFWFEINLPLQDRTRDEAARVLIVHPEAAQRSRLQGLLDELSLPSVSAANSTDALEMLMDRRDQLDCVLINYVLPDLDGETLGRTIHARVPGLDLFVLQPVGVELPARRLERAGFARVLPAQPTRDDLQNRLTEPVAAPTEVEPPISERLRVLVVEDNPVNQKVVVHVLKKLDCHVDLADNGLVAVEQVSSQPRYDMILMDCQMPEMDGYEATASIRDLGGEIGATPIVALTANAMEGDREKCLTAGMDDYMSKPATGTQIAAMLEKWTAGALVEA